MSFLLDENLSWRLVRRLEPAFGPVEHVSSLGLQSASDLDIWRYARAQNWTLISKDDDFRELVERLGYPPKLVWINAGNLSSSEIATLLISAHERIQQFVQEGPAGILEIRSN